MTISLILTSQSSAVLKSGIRCRILLFRLVLELICPPIPNGLSLNLVSLNVHCPTVHFHSLSVSNLCLERRRTMNENILQVKALTKHFDIGRGQRLQAVNHVTFDVRVGETFGLVGESGCGKSTIGRTVMGLYDKTDGDVFYNGQNVHDMSAEETF